MEDPTDTSPETSEVEQITDDGLEQVMRDFNEFWESMSQTCLSDSKLEDLIDLYISNAGQNSYAQTTTSDPTELLQDFDKFESMMPSNQVESTHIQTEIGFNKYKQVKESEIMIREMAEDTQTVNINSDIDTDSSKRVNCIRYGELNRDGAARGIISSVFGGFGTKNVSGSLIKFLRYTSVVNRKEREKRKSNEEIVAPGKEQESTQAPADLKNPASTAGKDQGHEQRLKKRLRTKINYLQF